MVKRSIAPSRHARRLGERLCGDVARCNLFTRGPIAEIIAIGALAFIAYQSSPQRQQSRVCERPLVTTFGRSRAL